MKHPGLVVVVVRTFWSPRDALSCHLKEHLNEKWAYLCVREAKLSIGSPNRTIARHEVSLLPNIIDVRGRDRGEITSLHVITTVDENTNCHHTLQ